MTVRRVLLDGLARDADIFELLSGLAPLHPRDNTFPGEVFLHVAADALDWCGARRAGPLPLEGLRERFLAECTFRGRENTKLQYAVLAAAALHGGTEPDLLDEVPWWQTDDILPGQFGNGFSSSTSNTPPPSDRGAFPQVTIGDDVRAQHLLVTETFGIEKLQLVLGWSMGAEQTYEWAVRYPDMVLRAIPFAGTAKTTPHDWLFVRMHENVIKADPAWRGGFYDDPAEVRAGLKAHAEVWSVMGVTQQFYRNEDWREVGFSSLDDFMRNLWEGWFIGMDPNNLLTMAWKWRHGDVSKHTGGDLAAALGRIKAKTFVTPFAGDMFFPVSDLEDEQALIPDSELRVIDSTWGHFAMFAMTDRDREAIDTVIGDLLATKIAT